VPDEAVAPEATNERTLEAGSILLAVPASQKDVSNRARVMRGVHRPVAKSDLREEGVRQVAIERVQMDDIGLKFSENLNVFLCGRNPTVRKVLHRVTSGKPTL
jgi:hypothetical protein